MAGGGDGQGGGGVDGVGRAGQGHRRGQVGDEEEVDEDEEMSGVADTGADVEDEEETKAKVEKMELGAVDDVRSVARLMKTLEPVLEVSTFLIFPSTCF